MAGVVRQNMQATMAETPAVKRTRRSGPRNKSGCPTCKIRHVKCDERRPHCFNCTSTGRQCDGYQPMVISNRQPVLPAQESSTLGMPSNEQTRRLYHSFLDDVVPSLSETLDSAFWRTDILRNSASRPAVQHAAVALGALYEQHRARQYVQSQSTCGPQDEKLQLLSSIWYTAAIRSLRDRVGQSPRNEEMVEEAMMACLLFVCIELLRGDDVAAVTHLEGAIAIFRSQSSLEQTAVAIQKNRHHHAAATSAFQVVSKIIMRLDIHAASYMGSRGPWFCIQNLTESVSLEEIPQSFGNVLEARDSLYFHLNSIMAFIIPPFGADKCFPGWTPHPDRKSDPYTIFHGSVYRDFSMPKASSERRRFMKLLSSWKSAFQGLLQKGTIKQPEELAECALLWLLFYVTRIKLVVSYTDNECLYDDHLPYFKKILEHVEVYQRYAVNKLPSPICAINEEADVSEKMRKIRPKKRELSIRLGINYPLYYVVLKCRYKPIRQKALVMLQSASIENVWDSQMLARIAEYVIAIEEPPDLHNDISEYGKSFGVPEARRIHCLSLSIDKGSRKIWLQYNRRVTANGQLLQSTELHNRWKIDNAILTW